MAPQRPTPTGPLAPELTIASSRVYRGPNYWSYEQAIHLVVDLGVLEGYPTDTIPGFTDRLVELLPGLRRHHCSRGEAGGFVERLHEGTWLGHVAEHVALQLQTEAGHFLTRGKTRSVKGRKGRYNVIYGFLDETVGLAAGRLAVRLVNDLVEHEEGFDFAQALDAFIRLTERTAFGPVDRGHRRGGGQPRHPVDPAQQGLARAARPGRAPAAHPGDHDVAHRRARGRHRRRQGPHRHAARLRGPAGAASGHRPHRGRCPRRGRAHRVPRRRQAARRQPRTRRMPGPPVRGRGRDRLRGRPGRVEARHGHRRVVRHRARLPLPHRRRPDAGHRRAGARPRRRRRHAYGAGARRPHQCRPAARGRPREGADPDPHRRRRRGGARRPGPHVVERARSAASW